MRRRVRYALAFMLVVVLMATAEGIGWSLPSNPYTSNLSCPVWPYSNQLTATVTTNQDGSFHYFYTLNYAQSAGGPLTSFSVGNMQNLAYSNPGCSVAFTMPSSKDSVYWYVNVPTSSTISFWYDSIYSYKLVNVTMASGLPATGQTLGMYNTVPEPSALASLLLGLSGLGWTIRKRRS